CVSSFKTVMRLIVMKSLSVSVSEMVTLRLTLIVVVMSTLLLSCRSAPSINYVPPAEGDLYVSPTAADHNDGRTRETALATITRASALARPGYVVLVAEGVYNGSVSTSRNGR